MNTHYEKRITYLLLLILAAAFLVLKVRRGVVDTEEKGGIWNVIQVFWVVLGIYYLFKQSKAFLSINCAKIFMVFSMYIWFLSIVFALSTEVLYPSRIFRLIVVPYGAMVMLVYFAVSYKANIKQYPIILSIAFLIISIILFITWRSFNLALLDENGTVADVYYVVGLLPIILLYTPKKLKLLPFIIAFMVVLLSSKRGALVTLIPMLIIYFFFTGTDDKGNLKQMVTRFFSFAVIFFLVYCFVMIFVGQYDLNMFNRMERLEEDGGSGRLNRWLTILSMYSIDSNFFQLILGHGNGTIGNEIGGHAHNDFLEFLYEYGIIALFLYIVYFKALIHEVIQMYKYKYKYAREFACSVVVALCMSMVSFYAVDCTHITVSSICQGLLLADWYKFKSNGYEKK